MKRAPPTLAGLRSRVDLAPMIGDDPRPMLGSMRRSATLVVSFVVSLSVAAPSRAQEPSQADAEALDQEARALFTAGSTAFENARYEEALEYFQRAFELSERPELLYNIGITADRLRRDREALEAFEQYLERVPDHPRRRDVEVRVGVLRRAVVDADRERASQEPAQAAPVGAGAGGATASAPVASAPPPRADEASSPSLAGPLVLGAVGIAGVTAAIVGLVSSDDCLKNEAGTCVEERAPSGLAVGAYGGLGLVALAGAVLWLVLGGDGEEDDGPAVATNGRGLDLGWSF